MKWIEIFEYINGIMTLIDFTHPMLTPKQEDLVKFVAKVIVNMTFMVFPLVGKLLLVGTLHRIILHRIIILFFIFIKMFWNVFQRFYHDHLTLN